MNIPFLAVLFLSAACAPVFAADLDELLPQRQEAPMSSEAPGPRGPRAPGMRPSRGPEGPEEDDRRGPSGPRGEERRERGPREGRPQDPELKAKIEAVKAAEEKVRAVAPRLRDGSETEKSSARTEARRALGELFDAKLAMQEFELDRLEKRSAELKAKIERKRSSREKAIDERLDKMGGDDDWE